MSRKKKLKTVTFSFVAETSAEVEIPADYPADSKDWDDEQWDNLRDEAYGKIDGEAADWDFSMDEPEISK
jgi:hypothetical protein